MRTMNLLQMLGGVAIAGAVAAGTTAFTAAGLDATSTTTTIGGMADIASTDIDGITLDSVSAIWEAGSTGKIEGMTVTFAAGDAVDGTPVQVVVDNGTSHTLTCTGGVTSDVATCLGTAFTPGTIAHIFITA